MVPGISVGWYSCASTYYTAFVEFDTTYAGENDGRTWSKVYNTLTSSNGLETSEGSAAASGGSAATVTVAPSSKKSTPVAAIAGGVVAGVVVIGAVIAGVLIIICLRKRGKTNPTTANQGGATAAAATAPGPAPAPDMTQQQPPIQSMYGAPGGYYPVPQNPPQGLASEYYGNTKQEYAQNPQGAYDPVAAAKMHGSPQVTQQEMHASVGPAPPYSQVMAPAGGISPAGSPPPNVQELNAQMPQYGQLPGMQQQMGGAGGQSPVQNQAQELPTQYATTLHNAQGQPIYEAPDQVYRSAP